MERRPGTQDISWFLDLEKNGQLNLDPHYQRRSVWTAKDRRYFLDTIFRNFPSPAIFLHKTISETGVTTYAVVDGKQRLETILRFAKGRLKIDENFGDVRLNNKRFPDLASELDLKMKFWNYQLPVEMIDFKEAKTVNDVFDRLNRNSRRLTQQELRHAKYDGWFITRAEMEANEETWAALAVVTRARATRMTDVQFLSELMLVVIKQGPQGFSQENLDNIYADFDEIDEGESFDVDLFDNKMAAAKNALLNMEAFNKAVTVWARGFGAVYTLWCVLVCSDEAPETDVLAERYAAFMAKVAEIANLDAGANLPEGPYYAQAARYRDNARGASTELFQRQARYQILREVLLAP